MTETFKKTYKKLTDSEKQTLAKMFSEGELDVLTEFMLLVACASIKKSFGKVLRNY